MKQFRLAFYKAKFNDKKWKDDLISVYTTAVNVTWLCCCLQFKHAWQCLKNRYSHVEVWLPNKNGYFVIFIDETIGAGGESYCRYLGRCFTSTMREEANGTVIRPAQEVIGKHPERWDIQFYECPDEDYEEAVEWAEWQAFRNMGYNTNTILNFINPFRKTVILDNISLMTPPRRKNICSVACQGFCWVAGVYKKWCIWSPLKLWWKGHKLGKITKPLLEC